MKRLFTVKTTAIIILILLLTGIGTWAYYGRREKQDSYQSMVLQKRDLFQIVSVTGTLQPASKVDLALERSGKVARVNGKVGVSVAAGTLLVSLDAGDIAAQITQAEASVASAEASLLQYEAALQRENYHLDELKTGPRLEELAVYEEKIVSAEKSLRESERNLKNVQQKAAIDIVSQYQDMQSNLLKSATSQRAALVFLAELQYAHFLGNDQESFSVSESKARAVYDLFEEEQTGNWNPELISKLSGGLYGELQTLSLSFGESAIDLAYIRTIRSLESVKNTLHIIPVKPEFTLTERTNLESHKAAIEGFLASLRQMEQSISRQRSANTALIASAESQIVEAQNAVNFTQDDLRFRRLGASVQSIAAQESLIQQAEANIKMQKARIQEVLALVLQNRAQIAKTALRAPIAGTITKFEAKRGEIVAAHASLVTIMSADALEVEAFIPEVDIGKVKPASVVQMFFDTYGKDTLFSGIVFSLDPAETVIEGVATYKARIQLQSQDDRLKSGMTADIEIFGEKRIGVLSVPQRSIIERGEEKFVRRVTGDGTLEEAKVNLGLRGSDGYIEVTSGLNEGDEAVLFLEEETR